MEGESSGEGSMSISEGEAFEQSSFLHSILSPGIIAAFGGTLVLSIGIGVWLCIYAKKKKKKKKKEKEKEKREAEDTEMELTATLTSDSTTLSSSDDSMHRYMTSEEQEANRYTRYDNQKPYLE